MSRAVLVFLDGFGMAEPGPSNPLSLYDWPGLRPLLGARPVLGEGVREHRRLLVPLDASLGVEGLPQSATGQVALLTGVNAPALLGYHAADNVLKRTAKSGLRCTFANAYTEEYFERARAGDIKHSATTLCVMAAGLPFRMLDDLLQGQAVYWDITNETLRQRPGYDRIPLVQPSLAGERLARLAAKHDFTLFECFQPDRVGHLADWRGARRMLELLDSFLAGCARGLPEDATLLVTSDHGNVEDLSTKSHTRNPVPLMALGPDAHRFGGVSTIAEVVPAIYLSLGLPDRQHPAAGEGVGVCGPSPEESVRL